MKKLIALLCAVCLLLALCACSGSEVSSNPDDASDLWAQEEMKGVVHDGYAIQAASATAEQLLYAAIYQCYPFQPIEGAQYLNRFALYVSNTGSDGVVWYAPVYVSLPYDPQADVASYADYATAYTEYGQVRVMATAVTMAMEESELEELREEMGWDQLSDVDLLLNYGLFNRLEADELTFVDEGVSVGTVEDRALGVWRSEGEKGPERVFYLLDAVGTDAKGNLAVVIVEIRLPAAMEESSVEMAVWKEIYAAYGLGEWLEA